MLTYYLRQLNSWVIRHENGYDLVDYEISIDSCSGYLPTLLICIYSSYYLLRERRYCLSRSNGHHQQLPEHNGFRFISECPKLRISG